MIFLHQLYQHLKIGKLMLIVIVIIDVLVIIKFQDLCGSVRKSVFKESWLLTSHVNFTDQN